MEWYVILIMIIVTYFIGFSNGLVAGENKYLRQLNLSYK